MRVFLRAPRGVRVIALRSVFSPLALVAFLYLPLLPAAASRTLVSGWNAKARMRVAAFPGSSIGRASGC